MEPAESSTDVFRGISDAFSAALHHTIVPPVAVAVVSALVFASATHLIIRWIRRDGERAREQQAREKQRLRIAALSARERREFVRVPARLPFSVPPSAPRGRPSLFETHDVSGGGLSFRSRTPPAIGTKLQLVLDLPRDQGRARELEMDAEVVRIQPSTAPADSALVGLAFRDLTTSTRETLLQWIAAEERRDIAARQRGPVCSVCHRPLAEGDATMHPTCAPPTAA